MDIFKGNTLLEQNIFNSLNWGNFIVETFKERLAPFVFLYNGNEKVKTLLLQETEDDFSFAVKSIQSGNIPFTQAIVGYQTMIQLEVGKPPIEIIAIKGFDLHEPDGHFFAQQLETSGNGEFKKMGRPKYLGTFQTPLPLVETTKENAASETFTNVIVVKEGTKMKPVIFLGHESETEMVELYKKYIMGYLKEFDTKNLSGNFEVNLIPRPNIHKDFLTYLIHGVSKEIISSEFVVKELTHNLKPLSIQVKYNEEVIYNDSTGEAVKMLGELMGILNKSDSNENNINDNSKQSPNHPIRNSTNEVLKNESIKKWWQFWK